MRSPENLTGFQDFFYYSYHLQASKRNVIISQNEM
nr:MAG TPA: hypothetical protein [Caudoviricetes sp.]